MLKRGAFSAKLEGKDGGAYLIKASIYMGE